MRTITATCPVLTDPADPTERSRAGRRGVAIATVFGMLVAGLVAVPSAITAAVAAEPGQPETFLVSQTDSATSSQVSLTPDGQRVALTSTASDLVEDDTNSVADVFLSTAIAGSDDPFSGAAELISTPDGSLPQEAADGASSHPVASANGRYVAFLSAATNLAPGASAPEAFTGVFVRDTELDKTMRLDAPDGQALGDASRVDISDDGRFVVFVSTAANLTAGDTNGAADAFLADLDANGDGVRGDLVISRVLPDRQLVGGISDVVISGNGAHLAFTAHAPIDAADPAGQTNYVYRATRASAGASYRLLAAGAYEPTINGNGEVVVFIQDAACAGNATLIASLIDLDYIYTVALATNLVEFRSGGTISAPVVSADGNMVAWETTRPRFSFAGIAPVLTQPVVRTAIPGWSAATTGGRCSHNFSGDFQDLAPGSSPTVSASARTVAFSGPSALAPGAAAAAVAVDTHAHEGLVVSSTQGELLNSGYMAIVDISKIPVSALQGYAAALADAPIYRLPIYRLPIYRLPIYRLPIYRLLIEDSPIYRLPIYRLPIYRLDIPGGWPELLEGTPFSGELVQSITLADVLKWATDTLADGSTATEAERVAATRIHTLTLSDVDLSDSGIDSLSLASMTLGGAPLVQVTIPGTGTPEERWQSVVNAQGLGIDVDDKTILADLDAAGLDIARSGVEEAVLADLPIAQTLFDTIPMDRLFLEDTDLGALDVAALSEATRVALFGTDAAATVAGTLAANRAALLPTSTVADLAASTPETITFGTLLFSELDAASYPWEQIEPSSIDPNAAARDYLGNPLTDPGLVTGVTLVSTTSLSKNPKVNETSYTATGPFAYNATRGTWVGSIPTLAAKNKVYTYRIDLSDGTSFTVTFTVS